MRRATPVIALLLLYCGGPPLTGPEPVSADSSACESSQGPLTISLRQTEGPGLEAVLSNCSGEEQVLLHDGHLQDCELVLVDGSGARVESFDERMIMKFDNTPHAHLFQTLAPGEGIVIHDERFLQRDGGGWEMHWGPHRFAEIEAGTYEAHVEWTSRIESWYDEETGQHDEVEGIWTGTIRSNEVTVTLP
jgi:hypothetical protein